MNLRRLAWRRTLRVDSWNTHNANDFIIREYVKDCLNRGAVAVVLTEVWKRHDALTKVARDLGLHMISEPPGDRNGPLVSEAGDTVLLLAPSFALEEWSVIVMANQWTVVSAARRHAPRRILRAVGTVNGQRVELLAVHGPTGANSAAVAEFKGKVAQILARTKPGTVSIAAGDFNVPLGDARGWAKDNGLRVSGRGPDLSLVAGGRTRSRKGAKSTSDHYAMSHKIKPAKRKK